MTTHNVSGFSDEGLMCLHLIYASTVLSGKYSAEDERTIRFSDNARFLLDELVARVPLSHLWEIEKLQLDLNIKIQ